MKNIIGILIAIVLVYVLWKAFGFVVSLIGLVLVIVIANEVRKKYNHNNTNLIK